MRFDAVINRFMFEANFNRRISIHGNGKQSRGFIHISSVAEALAQILQAKVPSGTYNLVEKNLQVLDIVDVLKEIYPDLEFIFVNQHLTLRDLTVDTQLKLSEYLPNILPNNLLRKELAEFKKHFSF
jgi:UDP-glucose 4-epimerase